MTPRRLRSTERVAIRRSPKLAIRILLAIFVPLGPCQFVASAVEDIEEVVPGHVSCAVRTEGDRAFSITLQRGEFILIFISVDGPGYTARFGNPAGKVLVAASRHEAGILPLSIVAAVTGRYIVRVHFDGVCRPRGVFDFALESRRNARPLDTSIVHADSIYDAALMTACTQDAASLLRAEGLLEQSQQLYLASGEQLSVARTMNDLGALCLLLADPDRALASYARALEIGRALQDSSIVASSLNGISATHNYIGDGNAAMEPASEALRIAEASQDERNEATAHGNLGSAHYALAEFAQARKEYETARSMWECLDNRIAVAQVLRALAILYLGQYDFAL